MVLKTNSTHTETAQTFAAAAAKEVAMPIGRFFVFSFLGGVFISFGALFSIIVAGGVPTLSAEMPGIVRLLAGVTFPIGLSLVVIAGGGLFTGDCAKIPFALWHNQITYPQALRIASIGYVANFTGALFVAWVLAYKSGTISKEPWAGYVEQIAINKTSFSFMSVFIKGIGANVLVCLAIWMATAAKEVISKVIVIWLPTMAFVALGWEHSIANMFFIPLGMLVGAPVSIDAFLLQNLLPATLGNIVGGALLVALPYYYLWGSDGTTPKSSTSNQNVSTLRQKNLQQEITNLKILTSIKQHHHENHN
jgi:formate transporter